MGECILFSIETLKVCPTEDIQNTRIMQWQCYANVMASQNEVVMIAKWHNFNMLIFQPLNYWIIYLQDFVVHNFAAKWQDKI